MGCDSMCDRLWWDRSFGWLAFRTDMGACLRLSHLGANSSLFVTTDLLLYFYPQQMASAHESTTLSALMPNASSMLPALIAFDAQFGHD